MPVVATVAQQHSANRTRTQSKTKLSRTKTANKCYIRQKMAQDKPAQKMRGKVQHQATGGWTTDGPPHSKEKKNPRCISRSFKTVHRNKLHQYMAGNITRSRRSRKSSRGFPMPPFLTMSTRARQPQSPLKMQPFKNGRTCTRKPPQGRQENQS